MEQWPSAQYSYEIVNSLRRLLIQLEKELHQKSYLDSDPLEFVHRYKDPWDQEAVALVSALLAYGNVKQIRRSVETLLGLIQELNSSPKDFVRSLDQPGAWKQGLVKLTPFVHRFNRGPDLLLLLRLLGESWKRHGSLGGHFLLAHESQAKDIGPALNRLIADWRRWREELFAGVAESSFDYLLTAPEDGSCCKRWCMFLRWMGRKDELDPGLWREDSPLARTFPIDQGRRRFLQASQLVIPIDTHTGRISQYLGLTDRKSSNWLMALEVTESLRKIDPKDPTRFDFSLARLGILDRCQRKFRKEICERCQLFGACKFAQRNKGSGA